MAIDPASLAVAVVSVGSAMGVALATIRRRQDSQAEQRARDWRDIAEQRHATITDKDAELSDLNREYHDCQQMLAELRRRIATLEAQVLELQRYDLSGIAGQLDTIMGRLDKIVGGPPPGQTGDGPPRPRGD